MASKITYEDKVAFQNDETIPNKNKVTAEDMNNIKSVVNSNAEEIENFETYDDTLIKQEISELQQQNIELKRKNEELSNVLPSVNGEGENITLNGTAESTFKKLKISGNSWQETREGYNLLNVPSVLNVNTKNVNYSAPIPANTEITISWKDFIKGGENNPAIDFREANNVPFASILLPNNKNKCTITLEKDTAISHIYSNGYNNVTSQGVTSVINDLMINIGDAKPYEEYGAMPSNEFPSKIQNCGDNINLLNIYDIRSVGYSITLNGVDITFLEKGAIKLNGTPTKAFSIPLVGVYQSGNYKLDLDGNYILNGLVNGCGISFFNGTNNINEFTVSNKVKEIKQKIDYVILSIKANASFDNEIIYPCLRKGTAETPHSQFEQSNLNFKITNETENTDSNYEEQNFTFPLAKGQKLYKDDYLADDGIHHKRKQIELDGTENWATYNNCYYLEILDKKARKIETKNKMLCSHFKETSEKVVVKVKTGEFIENYHIDGNRNVFFNYDNGEGGVDSFKSYLAQQKANGTPVTLEYELATEELEQYNEEQKLAYDEIIKTAKSYKDTTHIFSTDEISCNFEVEAFRDLSSLFMEVTADG